MGVFANFFKVSRLEFKITCTVLYSIVLSFIFYGKLNKISISDPKTEVKHFSVKKIKKLAHSIAVV